MRLRPVATLLGVVFLSAACRSAAPPPAPASPAGDADTLRRRLATLTENDPAVREGLGRQTDVLVAVGADFVQKMVTKVAAVYLDRVTLDLDSVVVRTKGEIHKDTLIGNVKAGDWRATITLDHLRGTLKAGRPEVLLSGGRTIGLRIPTELAETPGRVTVRFEWDSAGLANVVCHDFELTRTLRGRVHAQVHTIDGAFALSSDAGGVVAAPQFPDQPFRLSLELDEASWAEAREALAGQDSFFKCGLGLDPDGALGTLRELVAQGIEIRLPRSIFRAVQLPGTVEGSVDLDGRPVVLQVEAGEVYLADKAVWACARIHTGAPGARATADASAPRIAHATLPSVKR